MAKSEMKSGANIGSASLILIFIVLCLGTFGLLSLTSAKNDLDLAERNAAAVAGYYQADASGEEFRMEVDRLAKEAAGQSRKTPEDYLAEALESSGQESSGISGITKGFLPEEKSAWAEIGMDNGQALSIKIRVETEEGPGSTSVRQWMVYNREEYEIDQDMPVWSGE